MNYRDFHINIKNWMDNDYIESDSVQPEEPRDPEQESL